MKVLKSPIFWVIVVLMSCILACCASFALLSAGGIALFGTIAEKCQENRQQLVQQPHQELFAPDQGKTISFQGINYTLKDAYIADHNVVIIMTVLKTSSTSSLSFRSVDASDYKLHAYSDSSSAVTDIIPNICLSDLSVLANTSTPSTHTLVFGGGDTADRLELQIKASDLTTDTSSVVFKLK